MVKSKNQNKANSLREGKWINISSHLFKVGVCVWHKRLITGMWSWERAARFPSSGWLPGPLLAWECAHFYWCPGRGVGSSASLQCEPCVPLHPHLEYQHREFLWWVIRFWDKPLLLLLPITQAYRECCCYPQVRHYALQWDWEINWSPPRLPRCHPKYYSINASRIFLLKNKSVFPSDSLVLISSKLILYIKIKCMHVYVYISIHTEINTYICTLVCVCVYYKLRTLVIWQ